MKLTSLIGRFLVLTVVAGLGLCPVSSAFAGAVAYSVNDVFNFTITPGIAGNLMFGDPTGFSASAATLGPFATARDIVRNPPFDPNPSCLGNGCAAVENNDFRPLGPHLAKGDAVIDSTDLSNGARFRNDALLNFSMTDFGTGVGRNDLNPNFTLDKADTLTIAFAARPALELLLEQGDRGSVEASLDFRIKITQFVGGGGTIVHFIWTPDGTVNENITGGTEVRDDAGLSLDKSLDIPGSDFTYDPAGFLTGKPDNPNCTVTGGCKYKATTDMLPSGLYFVDIDIAESVMGNVNVQAPEPATALLLALGLGGVAIATRCRQWRR